MKISRSEKQIKAFWRSAQRIRKKWESEKPVTQSQINYGQYQRTCERIQGYAAGWIAGVAWVNRIEKSSNQSVKNKKKNHESKTQSTSEVSNEQLLLSTLRKSRKQRAVSTLRQV